MHGRMHNPMASCGMQASEDVQSSGILTKLLAVGPDKLRRLVSRDAKLAGNRHSCSLFVGLTAVVLLHGSYGYSLSRPQPQASD